MQDFKTNPGGSPAYIVKDAARALVRRAEARLRPLGLGVAYLPVMAALKNGQAKTQADLARLLGVEQPSMAQLLARMERDGLLDRTPDPHHNRSQIVKLTAAGKNKLPLSIEAMNEGNLVALRGFSPEEVEQFVVFLKRFNSNLEAARQVEISV
ncbi:MarR family transcriptional regulator [Bradyrhizobium jicamae]|uniref:MarR family winged helix-turn-helix transcriptional regulator n=1 Tax=Bradyrhizobium jicamae TaxID=280332 RepID=UPI001BA7AEA3|nr:MarR family transcriptional regulator [Bradyrhizobium jicamae]MBR0755305.1 MarR family transcriptional regulator [Bradyrhizobium jicamae]